MAWLIVMLKEDSSQHDTLYTLDFDIVVASWVDKAKQCRSTSRSFALLSIKSEIQIFNMRR
jgi:hypothetical protein